MAMIKASEKTKPQARRAEASNRKRDGRNMFWRKPSNLELDQAGDFILKNLKVMREEATARGDSR
ncbi:MAG TPA: hypothetical protein DCG89_09320 [Spartobacteria bacterium]|jgi:hypothetical protein|nr:hypothetical protein [Spartobacteria bacterium]